MSYLDTYLTSHQSPVTITITHPFSIPASDISAQRAAPSKSPSPNHHHLITILITILITTHPGPRPRDLQKCDCQFSTPELTLHEHARAFCADLLQHAMSCISFPAFAYCHVQYFEYLPGASTLPDSVPAARWLAAEELMSDEEVPSDDRRSNIEENLLVPSV